MIGKVLKLSEDEMANILTYAGYVLLSYELMKSMIVQPIKSFYKNTTFKSGPFKSYKDDVLKRHKNEFEACLLYLKDFIEAIDSQDFNTFQKLRHHRNDLAHNLPKMLDLEQITNNSELLNKTKEVIFKLSNYRTYMEIGQEPELRGIDWNSVQGSEYLLLEAIANKVKNLS